MSKHQLFKNGIPISVALTDSLEVENVKPGNINNRIRILLISLYAFLIAVCVSLIAKGLVLLISLLTNLFFYGRFSLAASSPAGNSLGWLVILIPAIGGIIVGLMAKYGSKAIRGHGIPEAMEQVLVNQSRIKPAITYLKPLSSAIAIGSGGPFGAEGPIIATGGALGSTIGQLLKITHNERKILLAAGATAGMSAIFGSPIAAIFLAIELLLFEFSPRSIIPVALACITGAAGHHFLFEQGPVFGLPGIIETPSNSALFGYSVIGLIIGVLSVLVTRCVYFIEDCFEKLPVHWMWWPSIGGLCVGIVGYFFPRTMGVGYENISELLTGSLPMQLIFSLCIMKFISWSVALGSGTSGGTLAPLLTIGGATGILLGTSLSYFFPNIGISLPLAALVGMSSMFAGASRALLTSILFAIETTSQSNALLPLLAACTASYFISFFLMENTIMTEKIVRRGIKTPFSYEPDLLRKITVSQVFQKHKLLLNEETPIDEAKESLNKMNDYKDNHFIVVNDNGECRGLISTFELFNTEMPVSQPVSTISTNDFESILPHATLSEALEKMASTNTDTLPVVNNLQTQHVVGVLSWEDIANAYQHNSGSQEIKRQISLKRTGLRMLVRGKKIISLKPALQAKRKM